MQNSAESSFFGLLRRARGGEGAARQHLLEGYYNYLRVLAGVGEDRRLRSKISDSDVVQETLLQANQDLRMFQGATEAEFTGWLRAILGMKKALLARKYYGAACRDLRFEQRLHEDLEHSSRLMDRALIDRESSPSRLASRREMAVLLADAISQLPGHYRQVVVLHHIEGRKMSEVAELMDRTPDSVKKLWARAMVRLRLLMKKHE